MSDTSGSDFNDTEVKGILDVFNDLTRLRRAPEQAARLITDNVMMKDDIKEAATFVISYILGDARDSTKNQAVHVDLLKCLEQIPVLGRDGRQVIADWKPNRFWQDFQTLGWKYTNVNMETKDPFNGDKTERWKERWRNLNHFLALFIVKGFRGTYWDNNPLWAIGWALDAHIDAELQWRIPGAAVWIFVAGAELLSWSRKPYQPESRNAHRLGVQRCPPDFSAEKWEGWKAQFGALSQRSELSIDVREEAARAQARMIELEAA